MTSVQPQRSAADAGGAAVDGRNHLLHGVRKGSDRSQQGNHRTFFRLPERTDGVFVEIMPRDASGQELDPGEAGAKHLSQIQRDDERTRVAHDHGHDEFPLAVRITARAGDYLRANYSVDENDRIVALPILVVAGPPRRGGMIGLLRRQRAALDCIHAISLEHGVSPSFAEIAGPHHGGRAS